MSTKGHISVMFVHHYSNRAVFAKISRGSLGISTEIGNKREIRAGAELTSASSVVRRLYYCTVGQGNEEVEVK